MYFYISHLVASFGGGGETFSSLKTGSLNLAGIYPLTEHSSFTLCIKIEIILCL